MNIFYRRVMSSGNSIYGGQNFDSGCNYMKKVPEVGNWNEEDIQKVHLPSVVNSVRTGEIPQGYQFTQF